MSISLEAITRPAKDLIEASKALDINEIRLAIDSYYQIQEVRKGIGNQIYAIDSGADGGSKKHTMLDWMHAQMTTMEGQIERVMDKWSYTRPEGAWLRSIKGIGPVLACNFMAHLDITKSPTAGGFWRFAGLDPTLEWKPKTRRPWNANLKTACWKASDSWVKLKNHADSHYSALYVERKEKEIALNESGALAEQAKIALQTKDWLRDTKAKACYLSGKLPPAHLEARARRWTVKIFLSHLHHVMYCETYGQLPPKPYIIEHGGHAHLIAVPNYERQF